MSSSKKMNPHKLASALTSLYFPDTPSGPYRNRRSLFIPEEERLGSPYSDPVQRRTASKTFHSNKKRRVSFKPSLEVTEYYSGGPNDPYSLPLNDGVADDSLCRDVLAPDDGQSSKDLSSSFFSRRAQTDLDMGQEIIQNYVLVELCPKVAVDLNTTYDCEEDLVVDSSLVIPRRIQESLADLMSQKQDTRDHNKSVVTRYAPLHTSTSFSPAKVKLAFPPLSLDPLHSSLKYQRNKGSKSTQPIKVSIDKDNAILPISFFKTWYYKNANSRFLPASTSIWLQDYSTNLIEHYIKLIRARCQGNSGTRSGYCTVTPSDVVAVMKEYLELDDNININNLIHTYLPMELWFSYDPSLD